MTKPLGCPFCNKPPEVITASGIHSIHCANMKCKVTTHVSKQGDGAKEKVLKIWNKRPE